MDRHATNLKIKTCTGVKQISQTLACSVSKDYRPIFAVASTDGRSGIPVPITWSVKESFQLFLQVGDAEIRVDISLGSRKFFDG
jgi:hypothetical protein